MKRGTRTHIPDDERETRDEERDTTMLEKDIERKLREEVRKSGGLCLKFTPASWSGAPDRLVLFPGGRVFFVELKSPGAKPRPLQKVRIRKLREMGFHAEVLDNPNMIPELIADCIGSRKSGDDKSGVAKDGGGADA